MVKREENGAIIIPIELNWSEAMALKIAWERFWDNPKDRAVMDKKYEAVAEKFSRFFADFDAQEKKLCKGERTCKEE